MKKKLKRYYAVEIDSWDCNRHPYKVWNIIDRKSKEKEARMGQAWSKEARDLFLKKLNK